MDSEIITSALSSVFIGGLYVFYKLFIKGRCKTHSRCTQNGLQIQIGAVIEEQMTQHKDQILINVAQILNDKLQNIQLQPRSSILEESKADIV